MAMVCRHGCICMRIQMCICMAKGCRQGRSFGPYRLALATWTLPPGPCRLDPAVWPLPPGPYRLDPAVWTLPSGPCHLDPAAWTLPFGPCRLALAAWTLPPGRPTHPVASPNPNLSFADSPLPHSLTPSFPHSLTPSFPHSLTHSSRYRGARV